MIRKRLFCRALACTLLAAALYSFSSCAAIRYSTDNTASVEDMAGVLTDTEEEALLEQASELAEMTGMEFRVVTTDDAEGKSAGSYAEDYFEALAEDFAGGCYLLDLATGKELAHASMLNPQSQFGADVISRCEYAIAGGLSELSKVIRDALNQLLEEACAQAGKEKEQIYVATVVGNTCMHHLYMGIDPTPLTVVPYEAVVKDYMTVTPAEVDMQINPEGKVQILPNIAGFVGADTVGCLLATAFDEIEDLSLMIDIGTNGEMVMGNKDHMIACSTAAGPAFEGAKIECGMRGMSGAIDHIKADGTNLVCHVIDDVKAVGICGSGLMDAIAAGLDIELIDESGKIDEDFDYVYRQEDTNLLAFKLRDGVYLSQKDVREVQLAKGAIAAGIELMAEKLGIQVSDIKKIMIAGAFGNYMDPHSACRIGMLPIELEDRIEMIGNAAGEGSRIATLNIDEFERAQTIREKVEFLELASSPNFQDTFVDNLLFE